VTKAAFAALRAGDVVVFNDKRLRTVQEGPADKQRNCRCKTPLCGHMYVTFSILRRSWTRRVKTVYTWNDIKQKLKPAGKRTGLLMLKSEFLALQAAGFDVRKGIKREVDDARGYAERSGRPLCRAFARIERMGS
jgi:hypothetical protein